MDHSLNKVSTSRLLNFLEKPDYKIIDVRPVDAYNGWQLQNESRGGHIQGAKSVPAKWTKYLDWIEIVRHKKILPSHDIIVYGYYKEEAQSVAERFLKAGYKSVSVYNNFIDEWSANPDSPMQKL